jgi:hypothetical protein
VHVFTTGASVAKIRCADLPPTEWGGSVRAETGRVAGGLSPPGSHRSGRDSLPSPERFAVAGTRCPTRAGELLTMLRGTEPALANGTRPDLAAVKGGDHDGRSHRHTGMHRPPTLMLT